MRKPLWISFKYEKTSILRAMGMVICLQWEVSYLDGGLERNIVKVQKMSRKGAE